MLNRNAILKNRQRLQQSSSYEGVREKNENTVSTEKKEIETKLAKTSEGNYR